MADEGLIQPEKAECRACVGTGLEIRPRGSFECKFCEGRGWVIGEFCCSCGRPAMKMVVKDKKEFAVCGRAECGEKFEKLASWEFQEIGLEELGNLEDWGEFLC